MYLATYNIIEKCRYYEYWILNKIWIYRWKLFYIWLLTQPRKLKHVSYTITIHYIYIACLGYIEQQCWLPVDNWSLMTRHQVQPGVYKIFARWVLEKVLNIKPLPYRVALALYVNTKLYIPMRSHPFICLFSPSPRNRIQFYPKFLQVLSHQHLRMFPVPSQICD